MLICPDCGKENESFFVLCISCGASLEGAVSAEPVPEPPAKTQSEPANPPEEQAPPHVPTPREDESSEPTVGQDEPYSVGVDSTQESETAAEEHTPIVIPEEEPAGDVYDFDDELPVLIPEGWDLDLSTRSASIAEEPAEETIPSTLQSTYDSVSSETMRRSLSDTEPKSEPKPEPPTVNTLRETSKPVVSPKPPERAPTGTVKPVPKRKQHTTGRSRRYQRKQAPESSVVLINPDGSDGERFDLFADTTSIGSSKADINFAGDQFLAARHAVLFYERNVLKVRSLDPTNGVFRQIKEPHPVVSGDLFRVGQELLRVQLALDDAPLPIKERDGTHFLGSQSPSNSWGRLYQQVTPTAYGNVYWLSGREVIIGRTEGDICFPDDGYVSGRHATLTYEGSRALLTDTGSSNGTYYKLKRTIRLQNADILLIGQQLLRVEL